MLDHGTNPSQTNELIVKALGSLFGHDEMGRQFRIFPGPNNDYTNNRFARKEALSLDELHALQDLLPQLQTCFLPSLKRQIAELLESLDIVDRANTPKPKLLDPLEILSRLGHTTEKISGFLTAIAPIAFNPLRKPETYDHDYGGLKEHRCCRLTYSIIRLMDDRLWRLFDDIREYIPHWRPTNLQIGHYNGASQIYEKRNMSLMLTESSNVIDGIIKWTKQSDFSLLQDEWRGHANDLDSILARQDRRIESMEQSEQELDPSDEGQSNGASSSPVGEDQDMTDFPDTEEFVTETPDVNEDIRLDAEPTNDYQADHSDDVQSTDSLGDTSIRPHIIKLIQSTIPLIKLIRIFLKKLLNTPTSKPPFTIGTRLSSNELSSIGTQIRCLSSDVDDLLSTLWYMWDCDDEMGDLKRLERLRNQMCKHFDSSLILLSLYLVPITPVESPISGNHFKAWFLTLRQQFYVAEKNFRFDLSEFRTHIQK
ncbi:hypothetical protein MJO28_006291 [Puccinia striiformis f. sp. tritici]|uniref:Uncharacterized protein n=1 Tax=Puccinia striiformis f. sp. tritici TaxID=168172 RepID=A0ACC0EH09_9BASI|nr:hypothetical protein Pst134EA_011470 [Puccinia striiformis f. sp. tritici]KAH9467851.1 hypothetical protein Pst134EA_011470 [Puccinia striiformis f. sp. tritici]KAI7953744.1 hypothetical protein MJO28_006291 [Puccinia striiformis f. sp. tritici]KAI9605060.1 hypothetical protein H4Q26_003031 [Puccinia striiformis f. sp. tritici PST-130]